MVAHFEHGVLTRLWPGGKQCTDVPVQLSLYSLLSREQTADIRMSVTIFDLAHLTLPPHVRECLHQGLHRVQSS